MAPALSVVRSALLTDLAMCVNHYRLSTPGMFCCVHATVELADGTRLQPGVVGQVNFGVHKQCDAGEDYDFFRGAPNFILDVFGPDETAEYERRRTRYEQTGAIEYVAVTFAEPLSWVWNRRDGDAFREIETDGDDLIMSKALPGLWVRPSDLRSRDWWAVMATIDRGITRDGHHDFMASIWDAGRSSKS